MVPEGARQDALCVYSLHEVTLDSITVHYNTLHYVTLRYITKPAYTASVIQESPPMMP